MDLSIESPFEAVEHKETKQYKTPPIDYNDISIGGGEMFIKSFPFDSAQSLHSHPQHTNQVVWLEPKYLSLPPNDYSQSIAKVHEIVFVSVSRTPLQPIKSSDNVERGREKT